MNNDEKYSFNFTKGEFKSNKPGKETRFFLRTVFFIVLVVVLSGLAAIYLVTVSPKGLGIITTPFLYGGYRFISKKIRAGKSD